MIRLFSSLVLAGAVAALTACGPDVYEARGVVRDVLPEDGQVVIEHEKIPGFMDAMTMSFDVSEPALLEGLEVGHAIDFRVEHSKRAIRVVSVEVRGEAELITSPKPDGRQGAARRAYLKTKALRPPNGQGTKKTPASPLRLSDRPGSHPRCALPARRSNQSPNVLREVYASAVLPPRLPIESVPSS